MKNKIIILFNYIKFEIARANTVERELKKLRKTIKLAFKK